MSLPIGALLVNRYRIDRHLGRGGMGTVFQGWDLQAELPCAVKYLVALDGDAIAQFAVEAELLTYLRSPHVPRVYAYLQPPAIPGYALVMEYVAGDDLETLIGRCGPLDERVALGYARQVLQALVHLHSQQPPIIHRDIKPANLRIDRFGNAWLLDLGIGKRVGAPTTRGAAAATLDYAPPEQLQPGRPTDQRSDLFALGATLYHLVTGAPPPPAPLRLAGSPLAPPLCCNPALSQAGSDLIGRALELDPAARFAAAAEMQAAVEALLDPQVSARDPVARQFRKTISRNMDRAVSAVRTLPAQHAVTMAVDPPLPPALERAYGGYPLYRHQAESIERARKGRDFVVVTGTASGKSLCYNLPVLERCLADRRARALYLFPIKALINDQAQALEQMVQRLGAPALSVGRLHGDLTHAERQALRSAPPRIALSNPDFVHWMLARHPDWRLFFSRLQFIVLDEVHVYRGVFGSHVAQLMRRLLRICRIYGASPQIICCSATVANPAELVARLTGRPPHVIDRDGAARVRRHVVFWQPLEVGGNERRAAADDAVLVTTRAVGLGQQVITFGRARQQVEQMLLRARDAAREEGQPTAGYSVYRGGYTRTDREQIEQRLRDGGIRAVFTTNALEMGIDIGGLQTSVLTGFPGSRMSFWQQAGRAGRRGEDAHIVLIGSANPLDQYYLRRPEDLIYGPGEEAIVDTDNPYIADPHLCCMAREWPIATAEVQQLPPETQAQLDRLVQVGTLAAQAGPGGALEYVYTGVDLPHRRVSMRAAGRESFAVVCPGAGGDTLLETIEPPGLYLETHEGAIFYHQGQGYRVQALDSAARTVRVAPERLDHTTRALATTAVAAGAPAQTLDLRAQGIPATCSYGPLCVSGSVVGYREITRLRQRVVAEVELPRPYHYTLDTMGCWLDIDPALQRELDRLVTAERAENALSAALHGVERLLLGLMPTIALCDQRDLGSQYVEHFGDQGLARIYLYDRYPGGIGLAERGYRQMARLLARAAALVTSCPCLSGCPGCIQAGWRPEEHQPIDKEATIYLLARLLGHAPRIAPPTP